MENTNLNLDEILNKIDNEAIEEFKKNQKDIDENFNEIAKKRHGIMQNVWMFMLKKLLGKLKIKITIYWDEKEIFNYVIPKN